MAAELGIIIISYNAKDFLKGCLDSVKTAVDSGFAKIIVVDNASKDGSAEMVESDYKWAELIRNKSNLGFAEANNIGIRSLDADYILLLNSDTLVTSQALSDMLSIMKSNPQLSISGCQHIDKDGIIQNPFGRFPNLKSEFITMTGIFNWPLISHLITFRKRKRLKEAKAELPQTPETFSNNETQNSKFSYVNYVSGASMMMTKEFASKTGGLDNRYFFYSEDADVCFAAWKMGHKVAFFPDIIITHFGGGSYCRDYLKVLRQWMLTRITFFKKNYSQTQTIILIFIYILCGILSSIKWTIIFLLFPTRRKVAKEWLRFWKNMLRQLANDRVYYF